MSDAPPPPGSNPPETAAPLSSDPETPAPAGPESANGPTPDSANVAPPTPEPVVDTNVPPVLPAPSMERTREVHPIIFHGQAKEYFRIWIVNSLLTLLTAGVFLAWAKVRKRRYLRGAVELLGHRFDYQASPPRLLVGHFIMVVLFLSYSVFGVVYPAVRYGTLLLGVVMLPWIVVRSLTFNAHNTVYRGLRFRFHPSLSAAALVFLGEGALILLTFGIYFPAWERSKRRYIVSHHRLGNAYFHFHGNTGPFYFAYFLGGALLVGAAIVGGVLLTLLVLRHPGQQPGFVEMLPFFILYGFGFFVSRHFIYAQLFNHVWNHTQLDEHRFRANLDTGRWLGLQLANLGAIIVSGGLLYPWAAIRAHRYVASCLSFLPAGPIENIERVGGSAGSATGDTAAEFVGLDFGL